MPREHVGRGMLFVTLTYPEHYSGEWAVWKRQLDTWLKRLRRRCPAAAGLWKLEPQQRGAPHYHLILVGVPFLAKEWLSRSWYEVVGSQDPKHLVAGTNIQAVRSHRGVVAYASKYVAKAEKLPDDWQQGVGRWWGVFHRSALGILWLWWALDQREFFALTRVCRSVIANRQAVQGRAPPRACPAGMWLVMRDDQAGRLAPALAVGRHAKRAI